MTKEQLDKGVKKFCLLTTDVYPGTSIVALIRKYGMEIEVEPAEKAWLKVLKGVYAKKRPAHGNEILDEVVDLFGWQYLIDLARPSEKMSLFIKHYNEIKKNKQERVLLGKDEV